MTMQGSNTQAYERVNTIIGLLVPVILGVLVLRDSVNLPVGDEWSWVLLIYKEHTAGLTFLDFWVQHNEHRILFPSLIMIALEHLGGYNVVREIIINLVLGLLTLALLVALMRRTLPARNAVFFLAASLLTFSITQYENWATGFQLAWFLVNLCAVAVVVLLSMRGVPAFCGAVACAVVASFSLSSGLDAWISGAFVIVALRPFSLRRIVPWIGSAIVTFGLYLDGYVKPLYHPNPWSFLTDPLGFCEYVLTYLGAPFAVSSLPLAVIPFGLAIVALFAVACILTFRRRDESTTCRNNSVPWLGIAVFSAVAALMTAVGRLGFGIEQAFASRYVTVSSLFWIGTLGALCVCLPGSNELWRTVRVRIAAEVSLIVFIGAFGVANAGAFIREQSSTEARVAAYTQMLDITTADNATLLTVFPDPNAVRLWTNYLVQVHVGPFR